MSDYLASAQETLNHFQMEVVSPLTLYQVEIDIQEMCRDFAEYPLRMDEDACETLATLYRIRKNLKVALESDRQRENKHRKGNIQ